MARFDKEFNFNEDIELMDLTYKMNTGNFKQYNENENILNDIEKIKNTEKQINPNI